MPRLFPGIFLEKARTSFFSVGNIFTLFQVDTNCMILNMKLKMNEIPC